MIPETDKAILGSLSRAARGGTLDPERLAQRAYEMGSANCHKAVSRSFALPETLNLNNLEKAALEKAIQVTGGSILAAAQLLGIGKTTAYRKVKQYGLVTGIGVGFCPNCGRRLPRQDLRAANRVSKLERAASGSEIYPDVELRRAETAFPTLAVSA